MKLGGLSNPFAWPAWAEHLHRESHFVGSKRAWLAANEKRRAGSPIAQLPENSGMGRLVLHF
jgi:hypothetical protein